MSGQLYDIRAFQTVRELGKQSGINPAPYINAIRSAQEHGGDGKQIAGEFRVRCWELEKGCTPDPKGVA